MVNVPVNDGLQFRVAAISRRHDGYVSNAPQADGDDEDTRSGRVSVALEPTSHLRMLFTAQQTTLKGCRAGFARHSLYLRRERQSLARQAALPRQSAHLHLCDRAIAEHRRHSRALEHRVRLPGR
jgi:hypothetical protein